MKYTVDIIENLLKNKVTHNFIFTLPRCEPCGGIKRELEKRRIEVEYLPIRENQELANAFDVKSAPTMICIKDGGYKFYKGDVTILEKLIKKVDDSELEQA